jgi:hypothetical protein
LIFLIGEEKSKVEELTKGLQADNRDYRQIDWQNLNPKEGGIYIVISLPREKFALECLKHLVHFKQTVILLDKAASIDETEINGVSAANPVFNTNTFLCLPFDTSYTVIKPLIYWLENNWGNNFLIDELNLASDLQKSLIPKSFPQDLPINIVHKYLPHTFIGGDLFDVVRLSNHKLGVIITDVSGHGISAAFITAMFKMAFNHYAEENASPAQLLAKLNKEFYATIHTEHYLTAFYAIFDLKEMKCTFCNAGHPRQILLKTDGEIIELDTAGFFVGSFENSRYEDQEIAFAPGDRFYFFTDGIIEISNSKGWQFGRDNLKKLLKEYNNLDLATTSNMLISMLMMYMHEQSFPDDITLIILEIMESL